MSLLSLPSTSNFAAMGAVVAAVAIALLAIMALRGVNAMVELLRDLLRDLRTLNLLLQKDLALRSEAAKQISLRKESASERLDVKKPEPKIVESKMHEAKGLQQPERLPVKPSIVERTLAAAKPYSGIPVEEYAMRNFQLVRIPTPGRDPGVHAPKPEAIEAPSEPSSETPMVEPLVPESAEPKRRPCPLPPFD